MPAAEYMKCTGKYKDLVKNGLGGTLDKPCANALNVQVYCNQPDVDAWNAVAWDLFKRVRHEWNVTNKAVAIPVEVADYITALENDYCESDEGGQCVKYLLPESSWYDYNWNATAATTIARWCSRATCALEILENVRGWQAPVEPTQESYELPEEADSNLFEMDDAALAKLGITQLPQSLADALKVMEGSQLVQEALGEHIFEWFLRNKRREWRDYKTHVSQFEVNRYLRAL